MTDAEIVSILRPDGTVDPLLDPGLPDPERTLRAIRASMDF